jgi:hypothetical protein
MALHGFCLLLMPKFWQISARAKPKLRLFAPSTPSIALLNHFISYEGSVWLILGILCAHGTAWLAKSYCRFQPEPSQNQGCLNQKASLE